MLFEPSYELNSTEGKARMDRLGYIKDIAGTVERLGGSVLEINPIHNVGNPLNPTTCFVIEPPMEALPSRLDHSLFSVPGTDLALSEDDGFLISKDAGLAYPILKGIPILKTENGILSTALFDHRL